MGNCASSEAVYADAGTAVQKESVKAQRAVYMSMCSKCFEYRIFDRKTIEGVLETIEELPERDAFWDILRGDAAAILHLVEWMSGPDSVQREFVGRVSFLYRKDYDTANLEPTDAEPARQVGGLASDMVSLKGFISLHQEALIFF